MIRFSNLLSLIFILFFSVSYAQNRGEINGSLFSEDQDEPLAFATISAYRAADTSLIDYVLSEDDGSFRIKRLPLDQELRMIISFLGYEAIRKDFTLTAKNHEHDFGKLKMKVSSETLEEVLVQAERPPIVVKNDTVEFNAAAFATRDGANVEELIKRLPGIVVDNQGNITANGRPVTKVRVDGKDFFGGDPSIALRNLSSDMIDKVQLADDREEDPQHLLADDEVDQVINLKLKKDVKLNAFGKAYAGGGSRDRFEMGGIINSFQDTFQLSMLGYYNNLTPTNLSMNEVLRLGGMRGRRGGGAGYPLSLLGGANANATFGEARFHLQYFYSHDELEFGSKTFRQQTIRQDSLFFYDTQNSGQSTNDGHNVSGSLRWKIDTVTQLNINIGLSSSSNTRPSTNERTSASNQPENIIQEFFTREDPEGSNQNMNARIYFNKRLNNDGRNFNFNTSFSKGKNNNELLSNFERNYFLNEIDSIVHFDQIRTQFNNNQNFNFSAGYTEPIFGNWFIDLSAKFAPSKRINNIHTSQLYPGDPAWMEVDDLSRDFQRSQQDLAMGAGIRYQKDRTQINLSAEYDDLRYKNFFGEEIPEFKERYRFLSPRVRISIDRWRMNYRYNYSTPDINQLHPVRNNTNPLYEREGNPDLTPVRSHVFDISRFSFRRKWNHRVFLNGNFRPESIITMSTVDGGGVTHSKPVNFKSLAYSFRGGGRLGRTFDRENHKFSFHVDASSGYGSSPFFINGQEGISNNFNISGSITTNYNFIDVFDFAPRYRINHTKNTYKKVDYRDVDVVNHSFSTSLTLFLPWDMEFHNDITYSHTPQVTPGFRKSSVLWHAALHKKLLKNKKLTLRISAYDLLDQNVNFYRTISYNTITDGEHITLSRYLLMSAIYDIRPSHSDSSSRSRPGRPRRF